MWIALWTGHVLFWILCILQYMAAAFAFSRDLQVAKMRTERSLDDSCSRTLSKLAVRHFVLNVLAIVLSLCCLIAALSSVVQTAKEVDYLSKRTEWRIALDILIGLYFLRHSFLWPIDLGIAILTYTNGKNHYVESCLVKPVQLRPVSASAPITPGEITPKSGEGPARLETVPEYAKRPSRDFQFPAGSPEAIAEWKKREADEKETRNFLRAAAIEARKEEFQRRHYNQPPDTPPDPMAPVDRKAKWLGSPPD
jgi:hypothetical protein